jgi:trans-aconitate methyltransferase
VSLNEIDGPSETSQPALYGDMVDWYRLVDPPEDHREETSRYLVAFEAAISPQPMTLLELGSGAGHNAVHLKRRLRCTLTDCSDRMLTLSRELNPECEHLVGDMRDLRLGRQFDAVLVHDAICHMTTEADLAAAIETAFVHTRPGGAAIFAPDDYRDTFAEVCQLDEAQEGERALRSLEWSWDPDPNDTTTVTEYVFLLRTAQQMRLVHDRHVEGLFSLATWRSLISGAGYEVETLPRPTTETSSNEVFICRRPG